MKINELKNELYFLTKEYFAGATVIFAKQSFMPKPDVPLVTISMGTISRPLNPPTRIIDGRPVASYPASVKVQFDLFTKGKKSFLAEGMTPVIENTVLDDMLGFAVFLNSEYAIQFCSRNDIAIVIPNTVEDLTDIVSDTNYKFRAMLEVTVYFTMDAIGYTASLAIESIEQSENENTGLIVEPVIEQTASGGGNPELLNSETGWFSNVEINEKLVKEEDKNEQ